MSKFTAFIREKQYLENVSPNTVRWYKHALKWLPSESPNETQLKEMVIRMCEAGLKATGCNAALRAINAFLHWNSGADGKCSPGCKHPKVRQLKEPQQVMPTFTSEQVNLLIRFKPRTQFEHRLHLLALLLLDTGCRISEALGLQVSDLDLDNLLMTLNGKGRKQRKVPISFELRKSLFKYTEGKQGFIFLACSGRTWGRMGALRSVKLHCEKLGFKPPARTLHAFRHTAAVHFVQAGGSVFHLQKMLGHTDLAMSRRYVELSFGDLQAVHHKVSLLSAH